MTETKKKVQTIFITIFILNFFEFSQNFQNIQ